MFQVSRVTAAIMLGCFLMAGCARHDNVVAPSTSYDVTNSDTTGAAYYRLHVAEIVIPDIGTMTQLVINLQHNTPGLESAALRAQVWQTLKGMKEAGWSPQLNNVPDPPRVYTYRLTIAEFWLLFFSPGRYTVMTYLAASQAASEAAVQWHDGQWQTRGDAFQQAYWSILLCQDIDVPWAEAYMSAHESETRDGLDKRMDLNNQAFGRTFFRKHGDRSDAEYSVLLKQARYAYVTTITEQYPYLVYIRI